MKRTSHLKHILIVVLLVISSFFICLKKNCYASDHRTALRVLTSDEAVKVNPNDNFEATGPAVESKLNAKAIDFSKTDDRTMKFLSYQVNWIFDSEAKKYKLAYLDPFLRNTFVENKFVVINNSRTYLFDEKGYVITGWILTKDKNVYFFNNESGNNEGLMCKGWKEITHYWFYFDSDGHLLYNTVTPDGYTVTEDGTWDGRDPKPKTNNYKENVAPNKMVIYVA